MSFSLYLLGFVIVIGGIAWGLALMHVHTVYIIVVCLILLGLGILKAVKDERPKDMPS